MIFTHRPLKREEGALRVRHIFKHDSSRFTLSDWRQNWLRTLTFKSGSLKQASRVVSMPDVSRRAQIRYTEEKEEKQASN